MKKICKGCGIEQKNIWQFNDFCSRSCLMNKIRELQEKYIEYKNLLK